jgi:hypothetical protein
LRHMHWHMHSSGLVLQQAVQPQQQQQGRAGQVTAMAGRAGQVTAMAGRAGQVTAMASAQLTSAWSLVSIQRHVLIALVNQHNQSLGEICHLLGAASCKGNPDQPSVGCAELTPTIEQPPARQAHQYVAWHMP